MCVLLLLLLLLLLSFWQQQGDGESCRSMYHILLKIYSTSEDSCGVQITQSSS